MDERLWSVAVVVLLVAALGLVTISPTGQVIDREPQGKVTVVNHQSFAQCLTKSGVVLFVSGNQESQEQQAMFQKGIAFVDVVNCEQVPELCDRHGVFVTPLWDIYGEKIPGPVSLGIVADISGCEL